jgi:ATP-dependent Clp protease adaptor protein ClpS
MADKKKNPTIRRDEQTLVKERLKRPRKHQVILHNDDFTPMEFVVDILTAIFQRSDAEATRIMIAVHQKGIGVAGIYSSEVAEAKAVKAIRYARKSGYPLLCTTEPE